jgi:hypothetical protein
MKLSWYVVNFLGPSESIINEFHLGSSDAIKLVISKHNVSVPLHTSRLSRKIGK